MSERDYSRLRKPLRPNSDCAGYALAMSDTLLDLMEVNDTLAKRLDAIERAATCGTGLNEPAVSSPAQADVGEASAESEWPRYVGPSERSGAWADGCILIRFDSASSKGVEIFSSKADKAWYGDWAAMENRRLGMGWKDVPRAEAEARIAAARGEKPRLDDAFPIPAPVEQGPTEGMKAAAKEICKLHTDQCGGSEFSYGRSAAIISQHVGPELAAKDAEVERLKEEREYGEGREQQMEKRMNGAIERQQYLENVVCGGQWRSIPTATHPSGKQAVMEPSVEKLGAIIDERDQLRAKLSAATAANVERDRAAEAMEWWEKNPITVRAFSACHGVADTWCVEGSQAPRYTPTAAILAAKAAAEGKR